MNEQMIEIVTNCLKKLVEMKWITLNENIREEAIAIAILNEIVTAPARVFFKWLKGGGF